MIAEIDQISSDSVSQSGEGESQIFEKLAIYDQYVDNPTQQRNSFFEQFFNDFQICRIPITKDFMKVQLTKRRKKFSKPEKQKKEDSFEYSDPKLHGQITDFKKGIQGGLSKVAASFQILLKSQNRKQDEFERFLRSKSGNQICWAVYLEPQNQSLGVKKIAFSKKMIEMLDYQMEEAALCFRRYREVAFNYISNSAYREIILMFVKVLHELCSLTQQQLNDIDSIREILNAHQITTENEMIGKNNLKILTQVTFKFITPTTLFFTVDKILQREQQHIEPNYRKKQIVEEEFHKRIYHSLASIYKLPKSINPDNQMKICSYIEIVRPDNGFSSSQFRNGSQKSSD